MLWLAKRVIFGETKNPKIQTLKDLNLSEKSILVTLAVVMIILGFYPQPLINTMNVSVYNLIDNYQLDLIYHQVANK
jgi:NADH-quinone oxidoreductase subunit M